MSEVLLDLNKEAKRTGGKLPPELVVYLVVFMGLYRHLSIQNVLRRLVTLAGAPLSWLKDDDKIPHSASVAQARDRLGWKTVRELFRRHSTRLSEEHESTSLWRNMVTWVFDGTYMRAPDTELNLACFTRPGGRNGSGGYPQIRLVALVAAFSHVVRAVAMAPYKRRESKERVGEVPLALDQLLPYLKPGCLVLMDRGFYAFALLEALILAKVNFVVRVTISKTSNQPKKGKKLATNDWLASLLVPATLKRKRKGKRTDDHFPLTKLRVITYQRKGFRPVTLLTNMTDVEAFPRDAIVDLYHSRWEVELAFREIKTHLGAKSVIFRSKKPERVLQEAYGLLIAYNCVRSLIASAAPDQVEPRRLSFLDCLVRIRLELDRFTSGTPPVTARRNLLEELSTSGYRLPPPRSARRYPREVKAPMSRYPRKKTSRKAA